LGGLGLRSLEQHSTAAYISSVSTYGKLSSHYEVAVEMFNKQVSVTDHIDNLQTAKKQRLLSAAIDRKAWKELLENSSSLSDRVRLQAVSDPFAADWLTATPSTGLGQRLEANEMQTLLKSRLGLPVCEVSTSCPFCPNKVLDKFGHHATTCKKGPDVVNRHNRLRNKINQFCAKARLNPRLEQGCNRNSQTRPADILIPLWSLGHSAALDITIVHPLNSKNIIGASTDIESCLEAAEGRKFANNNPKCNELGWLCVPIAVSTYGNWSKGAMEVLRKIASHIATRQMEPLSCVLKSMRQQLGTTLARCVARSILSRSFSFDEF
jgi:hypothetical protein